MKTIKEWANLCSDDTIRKQWIETADAHDWFEWNSNIMCENMSRALTSSFTWVASFQGFEYWERIRNDMFLNPDKYLKKRKVMFHEDNG